MKRKIAMLSPIAWRTPPTHYGAWETVASNLTEGLLARGWDVTLFATADSLTSGKLEAVVARGHEEDRSIDPKVAEYLHISHCFEQAHRFDLVHSHYDFMGLAFSRLLPVPLLTTIHGFGSTQIMPVYLAHRHSNFVSISDSDRCPDLDYRATVYNGVDCSLYPFREQAGPELVFLGRIHPDKGLHLAIEVARLSGHRLLIGGIIQDKGYFEEQIRPLIDDDRVMYVGPLDAAGKNRLFGNAKALLHMNTIPERFGLVLAEANCAGVPVIAMDLGSCREVLEDGVTGFLVNGVEEAVEAVARVDALDRRACRARVERLFSLDAMARGYEAVYEAILAFQ